ncbi:MAG: hypothetical protein P8Y70_16045 [Candidatus Lokiarchaeota archaeon]
MNVKGYKKYLIKNSIQKEVITEYVNYLKDYEKFLSKENQSLATASPEKIIDYSESLILSEKAYVLNFLEAITSYANYSKRNDYITKVIDISESYNAMDNLYSRVAEYYGESLRDLILKDLKIPPLGTHPEKKPTFTKLILNRLREKLGKEKMIDLLSPCLHGRPPDDIEGDKKILTELGIDRFLKKKHQDLVARLERHRDEGTLEFAQRIDDEIVNYVKEHPIIAHGVRKKNRIYVSKLPYQMRKFLDAKNDQMKRFFLCYCPWVRGAIKNATENEISEYFCHCSAGWYKLYWDQIFDHPVKVEPVVTGLSGALECKFAITIPENILKTIIRK